MNTLVFSAYWPECRTKFCFSLISLDKWSSGWRKIQPDLHLHRVLLYHTGTCMRHTTESWEHSSHSPHCMARAHLQPQRGTRDPAPLAPLPNPFLAWDRESSISRKGKETASTVCCIRVALLQLRSKWSLCPDSNKRSRDSRKDTGKENDPPQGGRVHRTRMRMWG